MIRDILRAALAVLVMAVAASLLVETRYQLAAIDIAHRAALGQQIAYAQAHQQQPSEPAPGRLRQFGRASIDLADAALGIFR
jgi:hypothetical protein